MSRKKKKTLTLDDLQPGDDEKHLQYLQQQTNKHVREGTRILNVYSGWRDVDPICKICGGQKAIIDGTLRCRICD